MSVQYFRHGSRDARTVAVTFDDGPNPPRTEQVIDILAAHEATATFFLIGRWVELWPRTVRRLVRAGHVVGNHSHRHVVGVADYEEAQVAIGQVAGTSPTFARAPSFDYASCSRSPLVTSGELTLVDADVNPADWKLDDPDEIAAGVLDHPDLGPGSIVNLHDSCEVDDAAARLTRPAPMIAALPTILRTLGQRGYELVGIDRLDLVEPTSWTPPGGA